MAESAGPSGSSKQHVKQTMPDLDSSNHPAQSIKKQKNRRRPKQCSPSPTVPVDITTKEIDENSGNGVITEPKELIRRDSLPGSDESSDGHAIKKAKGKSCKKKKKHESSDETVSEERLGPHAQFRRAKPFLHCELVEMVKFIEERGYEAAEPGHIHQHKSTVMCDLSGHLYTKFKTVHTKLQCQKRLSDLKVRQPELYNEILEEILQDRRNAAKIDLSLKSTDVEEASKDVTQATCLTPALVEGDIVTLTLQPVPEAEMHEDSVTLSPVLNLSDLQVWFLKVLDQKLDALEKKIMAKNRKYKAEIIAKIDALETKVQNLTGPV